jgi:multidrug efflux pump subunit AcrA (membrane-fusion protein)
LIRLGYQYAEKLKAGDLGAWGARRNRWGQRLVAWRNGAGPVSPAAAADHAAPPAVEVDVATVISRPIIDWQVYSGRLEAIDAVEIKPLVPGTIVAVHFRDGALVKKGDPLFTIDPAPVCRRSRSRGRAARDGRRP